MPTPLLRTLVLLVAAYAGYGLVAMLLQRSLLFPGTQLVAGQGPDEGPDLRRVWLQSSFGNVEALYMPGRGRRLATAGGTPRPLLLVAHGNYELIDDWPRQVAPIVARGMGVLLVEYPGYGRSAGSPSQASITEVMTLAYDWASAQPDIDAKRISALGRSLGGGAACTLVGRRPLAALILQSTFSSLRPFAHGMGLPGLVLRDTFDNADALTRFNGPILLLHGIRDDVIPHGHAKRLLAATRRARLVDYDCQHNDCPPDLDVFWKTVAEFLRKNAAL